MQITDLKRRLMFWRKEYKAAKEGAAQIAKVGQRILDRYRETHSAEEIELDSSIIGHLVRSPYPTEAARVADVTIFMLAGHDTTAYQVSWIVIELARHPEVVRKLRVELDSNLAPMGPRSCTAAQLSKLDYLDSVIKEGMRLWPVVADGSQRKILADIPYKNFILPKGSSVGIANFAMFRNGIHDGHAFVPERWNDNDPDKAILKELFIPFSHGKRNCIGQALALLELKLVIVTLFAAYDFEIIGEFKESAGLTLKPINADLKVTHRVK